MSIKVSPLKKHERSCTFWLGVEKKNKKKQIIERDFHYFPFSLFDTKKMYRRRVKKKEDKPEIPNNLTDFGYVLKDNGEIRSITQGNDLFKLSPLR